MASTRPGLPYPQTARHVASRPLRLGALGTPGLQALQGPPIEAGARTDDLPSCTALTVRACWSAYTNTAHFLPALPRIHLIKHTRQARERHASRSRVLVLATPSSSVHCQTNCDDRRNGTQRFKSTSEPSQPIFADVTQLKLHQRYKPETCYRIRKALHELPSPVLGCTSLAPVAMHKVRNY